MLTGRLCPGLRPPAGVVPGLRGAMSGGGAGGPVEAAIREKLRRALAPDVLELRNESDAHAGPPGRETHFRLAVVSARFEGLGPLQRHRLVHAALAEELAGPVHALAIQARTPEQWRADPTLGRSPPCLGGGKRTPEGGVS
ncbi:bolA-like protein 1 [Ornithorhynchus anatinus]|uniref:bolA-like protein 1 n=1 Tax=Ornithorhynchus anatinus TaxID=9258 RepID=UPI0010A79DC3|nr:bolA-like protein 1 [Ornithorhynchus anatinus]XP_028912178.1 bolA-like protein 1 [Ornithorhynchus anatinus]